MTTSKHMSAPVTHGELREILKQELATLATKADLELLATKAEVATLATKAELELWGGALLERIQQGEQRWTAQLASLAAEMARQFGAAHEALVAMFAAGDEKYATLPARVSRLEVVVFHPES